VSLAQVPVRASKHDESFSETSACEAEQNRYAVQAFLLRTNDGRIMAEFVHYTDFP
jgi:hypothetical protein